VRYIGLPIADALFTAVLLTLVEVIASLSLCVFLHNKRRVLDLAVPSTGDLSDSNYRDLSSQMHKMVIAAIAGELKPISVKVKVICKELVYTKLISCSLVRLLCSTVLYVVGQTCLMATHSSAWLVCSPSRWLLLNTFIDLISGT